MQPDVNGLLVDGWDSTSVMLMGMPDVGCIHTGRKGDGHKRYEALCVSCGRMATNAHHLVPKGTGGGKRILKRHIGGKDIDLYSPLVAVCGGGNLCDCHARFHHNGGNLSMVWEWDDEGAMEAFVTGELWQVCDSNSSTLWTFGHYVLMSGEMAKKTIYGA